MANSVFIPLLRLPADIAALREGIINAFAEFIYPVPQVRLEIGNVVSEDGSLFHGFIMVEGQKSGEICWGTVGPASAELTEDPDAKYLAGVTTRIDWLFAGIVAYAFSRSYGKVVFNDSGVLGEQACYTTESLSAALLEKMPGSGTFGGYLIDAHGARHQLPIVTNPSDSAIRSAITKVAGAGRGVVVLTKTRAEEVGPEKLDLYVDAENFLLMLGVNEEDGDYSVRTLTNESMPDHLIVVMGEHFPAKAVTKDIALVFRAFKEFSQYGCVAFMR
jgi:hypothetical protein